MYESDFIEGGILPKRLELEDSLKKDLSIQRLALMKYQGPSRSLSWIGMKVLNYRMRKDTAKRSNFIIILTGQAS